MSATGSGGGTGQGDGSRRGDGGVGNRGGEARAVRPVGPVVGRVRVPGSKSLTNRALVLAALASGRSRLIRPLISDDTERLIGAIQALGVGIGRERSEGGADAGGAQSGGEVDLVIDGSEGLLAPPASALDVGGSGTAMRFLAALAALVPGEVVIDGDARMRQRPIGRLLDALRDLGVDAVSIVDNGCPPVRVRGGPLAGGSAGMPGNVSSQFVSALLMIAPFAERGIVLDVEPPVVSRPYIDLTLSSMARFGSAPPSLLARPEGGLRYTFSARGGARQGKASPYRATDFRVPADASSAGYFFGAAAITGGRVHVEELDPADGQADARLLRVLPDLGCEVLVSPDGTTVAGPSSRRLAAFDLDMGDAPDLVPMLAVLALFADGPCVIHGAANLRLKESDRIHALATEIARLGAVAEERPDGLRIVPGPMRSARIETYHDHRIAMAFAIAGLATPGLTIADPGCVAKSFPEFWSTLARLATGAA